MFPLLQAAQEADARRNGTTKRRMSEDFYRSLQFTISSGWSRAGIGLTFPWEKKPAEERSSVSRREAAMSLDRSIGCPLQLLAGLSKSNGEADEERATKDHQSIRL